MEKINRFEEIYKQFAIAGAFVSCERYGELKFFEIKLVFHVEPPFQTSLYHTEYSISISRVS